MVPWGKKPSSSSLELEKEAAPPKGSAGKGGGAPTSTAAAAAATEADEAASSSTSAAADAAPPPTVILPATYLQLARDFALLGWTAFGGPSAHVAQFVLLFTEEKGKRRWLTTSVFAELFALAQCVPGPSSTQLAYGIGIIKKGALGGMLTGLLFQVPGLVIMTLVGVGAASFLKEPAPWLRGATAGLGAAGVALVAASAFALTRGACKGDRLLLTLSAVSAVVTFYTVKIWLFPVLILAGGLVTLAVNSYHKRDMTAKTTEGGNDEAHVERFGLSRLAGALVGLLWAAVLVASLVASSKVPDYPSAGSSLGLDLWTAMFRAGSMIFGGGQVVIPLLYKDVVQRDCDTTVTPPNCVDSPDTWVSSSDFYLGLSVVQALPGPLFNFAPYLGAVAGAGSSGKSGGNLNAVLGAFIGWLGLNAPGILLFYGLLPWWAGFRHFQFYRRALPGLNAAAVGLVTSAALQLSISLRAQSPFPDATVAIGMMVFAATEVVKVPVPLAVLGGGVLGVVAWATGMK